jgi:prophage regulatory protein
MKEKSHQIYLSDVQLGERYAVVRQTVWSWVKGKGFPKPHRLTSGCTRWFLPEVEQWEKEKVAR